MDLPALLVGLCLGLVVAVGVAAFAVVNAFGIRSPGTAEELAGTFGATISWFTDPSETPCEQVDAAGCYSPRNPDVIYISKGLQPDVQRYAILHEIGHMVQSRLGMPIDECAADRFAQSLGATYGPYCAPVSQ